LKLPFVPVLFVFFPFIDFARHLNQILKFFMLQFQVVFLIKFISCLLEAGVKPLIVN